ncbi:MAG: AraC family transcriptional regulator [Clostridia bacterium]|nr:AraC family transcriptional regulator [Clostridia bacterium]
MLSKFSWTFPPDRHDIDKDIFVIGCGYDIINQTDIPRRSKNNNEVNFHILYFTEGNCTVYIKDKEYSVSAGDLVYFYSGDPYRYIYHHDPETRVYWLHFSGRKSHELVNDLGLTDSFVDHSKTNFSKYFENIIEEIVIKKKHYNKAMNAHLYLLLTAIVRKNEANDARLDKVIALMSDINNSSMTLDDYARICHLSKSQFIRSFKNYTGKTPIKYKNEILIENAKWNLTRTNQTITEISSLLGFENIYYFSTMFKKATGFSPAEYRKHN